MTFYIKPPRGLANVKHLEDCVRQRLKSYEQLYSENAPNIILDLDYLAEDTVLDRLGHYLFRLVSIKSSRFSNTFIKNEVRLLEIRLNCYRQADVKYVIKKLKKHAQESLQILEIVSRIKQFHSLLVQVCVQLLQKQFLSHCFDTHDAACSQCDKFCFRVPFDFCPDLVASREYLIKKGLVHVYSFQWPKLFLSLYKSYLTIVLTEMRSLPKVQLTLEDDRIRNVILLAKELFYNGSADTINSRQGTFKLQYFDHEFKKFPPCMRNLYEILMKSNRLGHNARFDFSLYLKGIGLSMNDAFTFWEKAYSKEHASCAKCTHSWQENEKRYVYGIRHLYGLEGSRRNYSVKSCQQMQDISLNASEEGGCPFRHFDDENLRKILKRFLPPNSADCIEVIIYERKQSSKIGCELYFSEYFNKICGKDVEESKVVYRDPVQYYLLAKNLTLNQ